MLKKIIQKIRGLISPAKTDGLADFKEMVETAQEIEVDDLEPVMKQFTTKDEEKELEIGDTYWGGKLERYIDKCVKLREEMSRLEGRIISTRKYRTKKKLRNRLWETDVKYGKHLDENWY